MSLWECCSSHLRLLRVARANRARVCAVMPGSRYYIPSILHESHPTLSPSASPAPSGAYFGVDEKYYELGAAFVAQFPHYNILAPEYIALVL